MLRECHNILSLSLFFQNEFYYDFFKFRPFLNYCWSSLGTFPIQSVSAVWSSIPDESSHITLMRISPASATHWVLRVVLFNSCQLALIFLPSLINGYLASAPVPSPLSFCVWNYISQCPSDHIFSKISQFMLIFFLY